MGLTDDTSSSPTLSLVLSQPVHSVTSVADNYTTMSSSPITTISVVECLTTSVVTSISVQTVSTITTAGM